VAVTDAASHPIIPPDQREKPRRPVNSDVDAVENPFPAESSVQENGVDFSTPFLILAVQFGSPFRREALIKSGCCLRGVLRTLYPARIPVMRQLLDVSEMGDPIYLFSREAFRPSH
jgi:hypothetical protein